MILTEPSLKCQSRKPLGALGSGLRKKPVRSRQCSVRRNIFLPRGSHSRKIALGWGLRKKPVYSRQCSVRSGFQVTSYKLLVVVFEGYKFLVFSLRP